MTTRLLINPAANGGRCLARARALRPELEAAFPDLRWIETTSGDQVGHEAIRAAVDGDERLLVAGGDGTVHLAARGLAGTSTALGVLPLGTGNDVATCAGVPRDPRRAIEVLRAGHARPIDLGRVTAADGRTRDFVCVLGLGMDDPALARIDGARLLPRGKLLYAWSTLVTTLTYRPERMRITDLSDGAETELFDGPAFFAAVASTSTYAGGMRIAPGARPDDGVLDLVVIPPLGSRLRQVLHLGTVMRGAHGSVPGVVMKRALALRIDGDRPLPVTLDGERTTLRTPLRVDVRPGALRVLGGPPEVARAARHERRAEPIPA